LGGGEYVNELQGFLGRGAAKFLKSPNYCEFIW
jgi:hypothetical protein